MERDAMTHEEIDLLTSIEEAIGDTTNLADNATAIDKRSKLAGVDPVFVLHNGHGIVADHFEWDITKAVKLAELAAEVMKRLEFEAEISIEKNAKAAA